MIKRTATRLRNSTAKWNAHNIDKNVLMLHWQVLFTDVSISKLKTQQTRRGFI